MSWLRRLYDFVFPSIHDPVKHCSFYKKHGCAHVDGMLCNMATCDILSRYKAKDPLLITDDYVERQLPNTLPNGLRLLQLHPDYAAGPHPSAHGLWLWKKDEDWLPARELLGCDKMQAEDQIHLGFVYVPANEKNLQG